MKSELIARYAGVICDLDGVVYRGATPVPGSVETLNHLTAEDIAIVFATNNASRPPDAVGEHLRELGLGSHGWEVVTSSQAQRGYGTALRSHWLNGKKNDVVVVLGAPAYPAVAWADVIAWTDNEHFKVSLRDKLQDLGDMSNPEAVLDIVQESIVRDYVRKPMQDYEYLASEIEPPMWVIVLLGLGGIAASWGVAVALSRNQTRERHGRFGRT